MSPWSRTRPAGCRRPPRSPPVAPAPRCADSTHLGQLSSPALSNRLPWYLSWERIHLQCRRPQFKSWVGKILGRRERLPTPVFLPGEFHGLCTVHGVAKSRTRLSRFHFSKRHPFIPSWIHQRRSRILQSSFQKQHGQKQLSSPLSPHTPKA